jgi:hypothetical protein
MLPGAPGPDYEFNGALLRGSSLDRSEATSNPMPLLILKRASASRPSGEWNDDDFDVLADGALVGRIFKANAAPVGRLAYILHR